MHCSACLSTHGGDLGGVPACYNSTVGWCRDRSIGAYATAIRHADWIYVMGEGVGLGTLRAVVPSAGAVRGDLGR